MPPRRMTPALEQLINERVAAAVAAIEANRTNGNGGGSSAAGGNNGPENQGCTYKEFMHCKPIHFSGTEGSVGLVQWFEKIESVFRISNCAEVNKVKFATCTLLRGALTWWNAYAQSVGIDAAYAITWGELRRMMTEEYCPRNEIQKLESELWNLKVKGTDLLGYTTRFQELAILCPNIVTPEPIKIERYINGLPPQIQASVTASNPTTIRAATQMANKLMDQMVRQGTMVRSAEPRNVEEGRAEGKRKWNENHRRNFVQHPNKRQEVGRAHETGQKVRREYLGNHPYCNKCDRHHPGKCTVVCGTCKKVGHKANDCKIAAPIPITAVPMTCYECGATGHFKRNCPKLKKQNTGPADGRVYMITDGEADQDFE